MSITKEGMVDVKAEGFKYESSQELDELDEGRVIDSNVPAKYRGTVTDMKDMHTLGKVQVLRVSVQRVC